MRALSPRFAVAAVVIAGGVGAIGAGPELVTPARAQDATGPRLRVAQTVEADFPVADHRVLDVDGDGRDDLLVIGEGGEVRVWHAGKDGTLDGPRGTLVLESPARSLLAVADVLGRGGAPQLVVLSPAGLHVHAAGPDGAYAERSIRLERRARFRLRVGVPRFANIARDVNGDGRADVVLPTGDHCHLWLQQPAEGGKPPRFSAAAVVGVDLRRVDRRHVEHLSDVLESTYRIPDLRIRDVNGDGRQDLLVVDGKRRSFHIQQSDGSLPREPDVTVDLDFFRDTTPAAEVRLGRTLAGGDQQRFQSEDLDRDGIPDYVIAHRRKVWVFHGTSEGPQFTDPSAILKVAQDITTLLLLELNGDDRPDLVLFRVQVPTAAALIRGLLADWNVEIGAVGYAGRTGRGFETTPKWSTDLEVRLPALLGVIRDPDSFIRRFEDIAARFRTSLAEDFDGDGRDDIALVTAGRDERAGRDRLDVWRGGPQAGTDGVGEGMGDLARLFFEQEQREWDIDAILSWLGSQAERRASRLTGGRDPDERLDLRADAGLDRTDVRAAALTGAGARVIVVSYRSRESGASTFDVVRLD